MALNVGRLACVALVSAVAGTLLDQIHTTFDVLRYAHPCLCKQSCLVPFIMGGAGLAVVVTSALYRVLFRRPATGTTADVVASGLTFAAAYLASGLLQAYPLLLLMGYALVVAALLTMNPAPQRIAVTLTAMLVGTVSELGLTHIGFFTYVHPNICGLPYWIGGLYWFAGLAGVEIEARWPVLTPSPSTSLGAPLKP